MKGLPRLFKPLVSLICKVPTRRPIEDYLNNMYSSVLLVLRTRLLTSILRRQFMHGPLWVLLSFLLVSIAF